LKRNIYDKYDYVPLWRKGRDDKKYSYEFTKEKGAGEETKVFENFLKKVIKDESPKFGFLFGDRKEDKKGKKIIIEAVMPAKELAEVLDEFVDKLPENYRGPRWKIKKRENEKDKKLKEVLEKIALHGPKEEDVRTAIHYLLSLKESIKFSKEKIKRVKEKLAYLTRTGVWKSLKNHRWREITYLRNKFLGTYYYEPGLLKHSWAKENILKKMKEGKLKTRLTSEELKEKIKVLKTKCKIENTMPKFLFFDNDQFAKIDGIMKGSMTFFSTRRKNSKNLPILVCMDKNSVTAKCMCLGYRTDEKVYKRIRRYQKK